MKKFSGAITALVSPFTAEGKVDEALLRKLIRFQTAAEIDGIAILGTTGESPTLTAGEKEKMIAIAREETPSHISLLVGTGSYSTAQAIENTRIAERLRADAALVVTPYYNKPTQAGLYQHFKAIAEATSIPLVIYNIQGRTGQNLQLDTLLQLADIPTIAGIKEVSETQQFMEIVEKIARKNRNFCVLGGDDAFALPYMALGGDGIVSVVSNLLPKEIKKLSALTANGEIQEARDLHYHLLPLLRALALETNPIPIKAAMNLCQMAVGCCRLPLCALAKENFLKLQEVLNCECYSHSLQEHRALFQNLVIS